MFKNSKKSLINFWFILSINFSYKNRTNECKINTKINEFSFHCDGSLIRKSVSFWID